MKRCKVTISGKVQGVRFRAFLKERAGALGLAGWCRNLSTGEVEAVAAGDEAKLRKFLRYAREGPIGSDVDSVSAEWADDAEGFRGFTILR